MRYLLTFLACHQGQGDGNIVPHLEPAPSTETARHTGETGTSWTRTTSIECPGPYPVGERIGDDEGWALVDGVCTVSAPTPMCDERHLGVPDPPPKDAKTCTCDLDCSTEDFCGAGYCRPRSGALITVCVEEYWFDGPSEGPPSGQFFLGEPGYSYDMEHILWTTPDMGCRMVFRQCEQFPPNTYNTLVVEPWIEYYADDGGACDDRRPHRSAFSMEDPYGLPLSAHANQGCIPFPVEYDAGTLWLSVWYP